MEDQPVEIVLFRGSTGLGFNIRGGIDIPVVPGDSGIFVAKIKDDGAAVQDGRLQVGDKILSVNSINLQGVTHKEAVEAFITSGDKVALQVLQGAEKKIRDANDVQEPIHSQSAAANKQRASDRNSAEEDGEGSSGSSWKFVVAIGILAVAGIGAVAFMRFKGKL